MRRSHSVTWANWSVQKSSSQRRLSSSTERCCCSTQVKYFRLWIALRSWEGGSRGGGAAGAGAEGGGRGGAVVLATTGALFFESAAVELHGIGEAGEDDVARA